MRRRSLVEGGVEIPTGTQGEGELGIPFQVRKRLTRQRARSCTREKRLGKLEFFHSRRGGGERGNWGAAEAKKELLGHGP